MLPSASTLRRTRSRPISSFPPHPSLSRITRNNKSVFFVPIEAPVEPVEHPLANGGEVFWIDSHTVGQVVTEGEGKDKVKAIYAISINFQADSLHILSPTLIGKFPTDSATNFRFSGRSEFLVFSDYVFPDGNLKTAKEQDEAWENRGDTAYVFDETFDRHVRPIAPHNLNQTYVLRKIVGYLGWAEEELDLLCEAHTRPRSQVDSWKRLCQSPKWYWPRKSLSS